MGYQLGVDVGTTFTAAAVHRAGTSSIFPLSEQRITVPTMVARSSAGQLLVGWPAALQLRERPDHVVHSFKRRIGDRTPIPLGDSAYEPSWYMAQVIRAVIAEVSRREGGPPSSVALTHPTNWNSHKIARLLDAASAAGLTTETTVLLSEPEAAALAYASTTDIAEGALIAVYDLGGGSFDAAVLRRSWSGYETVGLPEGIERLGGLDFDAALYRYATDHLGRRLPRLDPTDDGTARALAQLHLDCVLAKERLSVEDSVELSLTAPAGSAGVTIERSAFEALVRPTLMETISALRRCLFTARITNDAVSDVLLTGGSSQIPLVAEMLSEEMGRPISVHPAPKELVAVGAANAAAAADGGVDLRTITAALVATAHTADIVGTNNTADIVGTNNTADIVGTNNTAEPVTTASAASVVTPATTAANSNGHASNPGPAAPQAVAAGPLPTLDNAAGRVADVPARHPALTGAGGNGRPPSLFDEDDPRTVGRDDGEQSDHAARPTGAGWSKDGPRSLLIGVLGAMAFVVIVVAFIALRSTIGSG